MTKRLLLLVSGLMLLLTACPEPITPAEVLPTEVAAAIQPSGSVKVSWNYTGTAATGFSIYRDGLLRGQVGPQGRSYIDTGVTEGATYTYAVAGRTTAGESDLVEAPSITVSQPGTPSVTLNSSRVNVTSAGTITLTANVIDTDNNVVKVEFLREGIVFTQDSSAPYSVSVPLTSTDNGDIEFSATATDADGKSGSGAVTVTVNIQGNTGPFDPQPDRYTAVVNTLLEVGVPASGKAAVKVTGTVLDNDGAGATVVGAAKAVSGGTVDLKTDGSFTFVPTTDSVTDASFSYDVTDGSSTETMTVTIDLLDASGNTSGSAKLYYVDAATTGSSTGSADKPFNTFGAAQTIAKAGDSIFIFGGNYTGTILPKANQRIIGEGSSLTVNGISGTLVDANLAASPIFTNTGDGVNIGNGTAYTNIGSVEIKGLTLSNIGDPNWLSSPNPVLAARHGFSTNNIAGELIIEDVTIKNPNGSGLYIDHDALDEARQTIKIYGLVVENPGQFGIWIDDGEELIIDRSAARRSSVTGVVKNLPYGGVGIDPQDEFAGSMTIQNTDVTGSGEVYGIRVIKNNKSITANTDVAISGNTLNMTGTGARGIYIEVLSGNEQKHCEDTATDNVAIDYNNKGNVLLSSSTANTVMGTPEKFLIQTVTIGYNAAAEGTPACTTASSASGSSRVSGTITVQ